MVTAGSINLGLSILLVKLGYGIKGVAFSTVVANFILVTMYFGFAHKYYLDKIEIWFYVKIILPMISFFCILSSGINIFDLKDGYSLSSVSITLFACLLFIIPYRYEIIFAFENAHKYFKHSENK